MELGEEDYDDADAMDDDTGDDNPMGYNSDVDSGKDSDHGDGVDSDADDNDAALYDDQNKGDAAGTVFLSMSVLYLSASVYTSPPNASPR